MPPLKGIDRGINGDLLKALEETGHGDQIVIVDASYSIPRDAHKVDYQGNSSSQALRGILQLVPIEDGGSLTIMRPDSEDKGYKALSEFSEVAVTFGMPVNAIRRHREDETETDYGFYDAANNSVLENQTLFVRTRDERSYGCAMFIVGHSQV